MIKIEGDNEMRVTLVKQNQQYAERMATLTMDPLVKDALGFTDEQVTLAGTKKFIQYMQKQEEMLAQLSRVILDEQQQLIGVITLKAIDLHDKTAHIGTWLGSAYWGKGYNEEVKEQMLTIAFDELKLKRVFAGATLENIRSQKAQQKLPYMILDVGHLYPAELKRIQSETNQPCILNYVTKESFAVCQQLTTKVTNL